MTSNASFDVFGCPLDGANLIEASAGTGKTWNICWLYLRLLLERKLDVHQILVVTFTNAATAELRERIRSRIVDMRDYFDDLIPHTPDPFVHTLGNALEVQKDFDRQSMRNRIEQALRLFDEAAIFTIHGFCQRALSESAFASGQAFALELLPDDSDLRREAVQDFWREHIASDQLGGELASCLLRRKDSPDSFMQQLKRRLAKPLAQYRWPHAADMPDLQRLEEAYANAQSCWSQQQDEVLDLLLASSKILNQSSYGEKSVRAAASDYADFFRMSDPLAGEIKKTKLHLFCANNIMTRLKGKDTLPPQHEFFDLADELFAARTACDQALEIARLNLLEKMLTELPSVVDERKRARRLLSFDDILSRLHTAIKGGNYPWLAESLRQRYPAALVDEFQDTDPLQFEIFQSIYAEHPNPLFLVGDPKQAIYRFRNADLNTYLKAKNEVGAIHTLNENQRSSPELIAALNQLFESNAHAFMIPGLNYQHVGTGNKQRKSFDDQDRSRSSHGAALQIWRLPKESEERITRSDAMRHASDATAKEIAHLLHAGNSGKITLDGRALQAGDIAVLVRNHRQGTAVKRSLSTLNVGSVELSQASVFESSDAEDVERVLAAICSPTRTNLLYAALATELMGNDADQITAIACDESALMPIMQRFVEYRENWLQRGIGFVYRQILTNEKVSARMLRRTDGERHMTNLLHLGELLHQAAQTHPAPDELLRWLQAQRRDTSTDDATQLRLESDQNLVKILTIHKSKGLEFPVVFCPFLWDGRRQSISRQNGREYHDADGAMVIDFRPESIEDDAISASIREESDAEDLRLIYVALTRAMHRCYLVAGCYLSNRSTNQSKTALLNWLLAGEEFSAKEWNKGDRKKMGAAEIEAQWDALAASSDGNIRIAPLPLESVAPVYSDMPQAESLVLRSEPERLAWNWRISSFSGLKRGAVHEIAASERDLPMPDSHRLAPENKAVRSADDILNFPRGANAGDCIHKAFESCDFTHPTGINEAIAHALVRHPQESTASKSALPAMLARMMRDVLNTPLYEDIMLRDIAPAQRLTELGFYLSSSKLSAHALNQVLKQGG